MVIKNNKIETKYNPPKTKLLSEPLQLSPGLTMERKGASPKSHLPQSLLHRQRAGPRLPPRCDWPFRVMFCGSLVEAGRIFVYK
jgi:hypothetical protein